MNFFVVGYNTAKVQRSEIPATYEGFTDPKWRGRIGLESHRRRVDGDPHQEVGHDKGMDFFRKLSAMKPDVRKGHVLLAELVAAGEVPVGLTMYNSNIVSLKRKARPIDFVPGAAGRRAPAGHRRRAQRPASARRAALRRFRPLARRPAPVRVDGRVPASTKVKSELNNFPFTLIEPATVLDEADEVGEALDELFLKK
jgi:iron(III) transport system substrate-binding protein